MTTETRQTGTIEELRDHVIHLAATVGRNENRLIRLEEKVDAVVVNQAALEGKVDAILEIVKSRQSGLST